MIRLKRRSRIALLAGLCWLGLALSARADVNTDSHAVAPDAVTAGGGAALSLPSHRLDGAIGEAAGATLETTSHRLRGGFVGRLGAPGSITDLAVVTKTTESLTLSWTAPGFDGYLGSLPAGTTYFIRASTDPAEIWSYVSAQVSIATAAVAAGAVQSANVTDLLPNTTYYLRAWTIVNGAASPLSAGATTMTLARGIDPLPDPFLNVFVSSVTAAWNALAPTPASASASGYVLEASRFADFSGLLISSQTSGVALSTLTLVNLNSDSDYHFRVAALNAAGDSTYVEIGSTRTRTSTDEVGPDAVADLAAAPVSSSEMMVTWTAPTDATDVPLNGKYYIQHATWTGVEWSTSSAQIVLSTLAVTAGTIQQTLVGGLIANSTHYFRLWTSDLRPNFSGISNQAERATLAPTVSSAAILARTETSLTAGWNALPAAPPANSAAGYRFEVSTAADFTGTVASSATTSLAASTLSVTGLDANTTYFARVGTLNVESEINHAAVDAASTLADAATRLATDFLSVSSTAAVARWSALPAAPPTATSEGYRLDASSTGFAAGTLIVSSATADVAQSTLAVAGLVPNTLYAFRIGTLNWNGEANLLTLDSTHTLTGVPTGVQRSAIGTSSAAMVWSGPAGGSAGYRLEASTASDFSGAVFSSATANSELLSLAVTGLGANTTYHFRAGAINAAGAVDFADAVALATLALPVERLAPDHLAVFESSITSRWAARPASPAIFSASGYRLEASSTGFAGGVIYSSQTPSIALSTLSVTGLALNTTYFFRVATLNADGETNTVALESTATLAAVPGAAGSPFSAVDASSVTVQWTGGGNPADTTYELQAALDAGFTAGLLTVTVAGTQGSLTGLTPNTTHHLRVRSLNRRGVPSAFLSVGSTVTAASQPGAPATPFSPVDQTSITLAFTAGTPANPAGTGYRAQISTAEDFSVVATSATNNLSAAFTGLTLNTTYHARVSAANTAGVRTVETALGSTVTLAGAPGAAAEPFSGLSYDSFTLTWTAASNPAGTVYEAQASPSAVFATGVIAAFTTDLSAPFTGLVPGTAYFTRVRAVNHQNIPSVYTTFGSTTTLSSAKPTFLAGTFAITNADGLYIDGGLYTNTLSPSLRVQAQSAFAPGLAVADTGAHTAFWQMNEAAGATVADSSLHGRTLNLVNAPGRTPGRFGNAVSLNGTNQYGVSSNLNPWRSGAANNQWSVAMWFRSSLARGFLFQTASANTLGGGTYDGEISWDDATGNLAFEVNQNNQRRYIQAPSGYADGGWHFVVAVLNTAGMQLYVDGQLRASGTQVTSASARTYATAAYAWVGGATAQGADMGGGNFSYFPGDIDDVLISSVAFTPAQIRDLYDLGNLRGITMGAPQVEISTSAGAGFTWTRVSTTAISLTGTAGTTAAQTFTSSLAVAGLSLVETAGPGASTNQVAFIASSLDANQTTAFYTVLVDTTAPTGAAVSTFPVVSSDSITAGWTAASDPLSGLNALPYNVRISSDAGFAGEQASGYISGLSNAFTGLLPNTNYFVRLHARDHAGNLSTHNTSTMTLAGLPASPVFSGVHVTSATVSWTVPAGGASGYRVDASTDVDFTGVTFSSVTANGSVTSLTVPSLTDATSYYFRVGSINGLGALNYAATSSTATMVKVLSVGLSTDTLNFGSLLPGTTSVWSSSVTVTNLGNVAARFQIRLANPATWAATTGGAGIDTFRLTGLFRDVIPVSADFDPANDAIVTTDAASSSTVFARDADPDDEKGFAVEPGASRSFWLRIEMPPISSTTEPQAIRLTATAGE